MFSKRKCDVLVVGAGPVGLFAALRLAERGLKVEIIDGQWRTAAHSYALALHPASLELLDRSGLAEELIAHGHRIETVAFYDGGERRGELKFARLGGKFPFVLVLPQQALEDAFERRLATKRVKVRWNHRLSKLDSGKPVIVTVDKMVKEAGGYASLSSGWVIGRTLEFQSDYVIGADGHHSAVRRALDVDFEELGKRRFFGVFELDAELESPAEVRVVLDQDTTNVLWPMRDSHFRWSLQLDDTWADLPRDRIKNRLLVEVSHNRFPYLSETTMRELLADRAPWFDAEIGEIAWSVAVRFERRLASGFGRDNVWLAGDSAHVTGPVGVQSMNVGLREADALAAAIAEIQHGTGTHDLLRDYGRQRTEEWRSLLGLDATPSATENAQEWIQRRSRRILECIPASGKDLTALLRQIGLEMTL